MRDGEGTLSPWYQQRWEQAILFEWVGQKMESGKLFTVPASDSLSRGDLGQVTSLVCETGLTVFTSLPNRGVERIFCIHTGLSYC